MTKWCLLSNPSVYDVERAIHALPVVHWNLGRLQRALPAPGDPVLVWRTLGGDRRRGLIGQGVIDGDIALIPTIKTLLARLGARARGRPTSSRAVVVVRPADLAR